MRTSGLLIFIIALLSLTLSTSSSSEHPLKVSFSKLIIKSDGFVDIETHIFWDDLSYHLEDLYNLSQPDFSSITTTGTKALEGYLADHFYLMQDDQKIKLWIKDISPSENKLALVVHMSATDLLDTSKSTLLFNTLLCDATPKQKNYIRYFDENYVLSISRPNVEISNYAPVSNY
ncbi:MAG: DUF6702 family protein [Bacteroidota bacterium]